MKQNKLFYVFYLLLFYLRKYNLRVATAKTINCEVLLRSEDGGYWLATTP